MNALFCHGPYFDVRTKDCLNFLDLAPKEISVRWDDGTFARYRMPAHDFSKSQEPDSDGASLPTLAKVVRPSLRERMFGASRFHDAIFRRTLEVWTEGDKWIPANLTMEQGNQILEALMFIEATSEAERILVFEALQWFGRRAWNEDAILATGERGAQPESTPANPS